MFMSLRHTGTRKRNRHEIKKFALEDLIPMGSSFHLQRLAPEQAAVRDPIVTASAEIVGSSIILDYHHRTS